MNIIFFLFNLIILSSIGILLSSNPIYAILFLILDFILSSFLLMFLNLEFFALLFLIIYVGAISVFFIFIILMVNFKQIERENYNYFIISLLLIFFIILLFCFIIFNKDTKNYLIDNNYLISYNNFSFFNYSNLDENERINNIKDLGNYFLNVNTIYIIEIGFCLFLIMFNCIFLTNIKQNQNNKFQINQIHKKNNIFYVYIY